MDTPEDAAQEWSREVSARIGRNVQEIRKTRGLSAQKLSDAAERLGYPIPRSTIANLEGGRKVTVSTQELSVLARALGVDTAALLYSPLRPTELVRPTPGQELPAYAAPDHPLDLRPELFPKGDDTVDKAWHLMRQLNATRLQEELVREALIDARNTLADLEQRQMTAGVATAAPGLAADQFGATIEQVETQRRLVESYEARISSLQAAAQSLAEGLSDIGIEPWPADAQYSPFWNLGGDDA